MTLPKGFDPPPALPKKKLRCKMGWHSSENEVKGRANTCKMCGKYYYAKTRREILKEAFSMGEGGGLD